MYRVGSGDNKCDYEKKKKVIGEKECIDLEKECTEQEKHFLKIFLLPLHPLTNFEIQNYYKNEPRFNGVYSRGNLPKIKDGVYVINLDEYTDIGTHWIALYVKNNEIIYFDSFGVECIPKDILECKHI